MIMDFIMPNTNLSNLTNRKIRISSEMREFIESMQI